MAHQNIVLKEIPKGLIGLSKFSSSSFYHCSFDLPPLGVDGKDEVLFTVSHAKPKLPITNHNTHVVSKYVKLIL